MAVVPISGQDEPNTILACQDRTVRVLQVRFVNDLLTFLSSHIALSRFRAVIFTMNPTSTVQSLHYCILRVLDLALLPSYLSFSFILPSSTMTYFFLSISFVYRQIIYGTENGHIGQLLMDQDTSRKGFNLSTASRGSVVCMTSADVDGDGVPEIVCGRDDGFVVRLFNRCAVLPLNMHFVPVHLKCTASGRAASRSSCSHATITNRSLQ
jgi:hypothetical protein